MQAQEVLTVIPENRVCDVSLTSSDVEFSLDPENRVCDVSLRLKSIHPKILPENRVCDVSRFPTPI